MRAPPLQPPLVWQVCLLLYCAGILAALWPLEGLACAFFIVAADTRFRTWGRALLAFALCACGLGVGAWQLAPLSTPARAPAWLADGEKGLRICGEAVRVQGLAERRLRLVLADVRPEPGGEPLPGRVVWTWDEPAFRPLAGQRLCVDRRPVPMRGFANAPEPEQEARWAAQGVYWRFWSRAWSGAPDFSGEGTGAARLRERLRRDLVDALARPGADAGNSLPQARAILPALLFGDRSFLSQATLEAFAAAGLAHSLALSGQHLALAGLLGLFSVLLVARLSPGIYLCRARALWVAVASLPPALTYLWLGNAPASLLRATCMLGLMALWLLAGRTATALDALLAALGCMALADPLSLFDLGLQLSVMCVAVICLWVPGLRRLWPLPGRLPGPGPGAPFRTRLARLGQRLLRGLACIFLVSLCIQVSLLPFMLARFGSMGLWFPLNVAWLPAVDLLVLPGAALGLASAALGLTSCARVLLDVATLPCEALIHCLSFLDRHGLLAGHEFLRPHWTALAAFAALGIGLAVLAGDAGGRARRAARRWLAAGLALLCVGPALRLWARLDATPRLELHDVGQGLAASLRLPGNVRLLMDGGGMASARFDPGRALLAPLLAANESPRLGAIINSHPDLDHAGGLDYLLRSFQVGALFHNGREAAGARFEAWREARELAPGAALAAGDVLLAGEGCRLEVLHPPRRGMEAETEGMRGEDWTGNDASLVLRLTRDGAGLALFTGDAGPAAMRALLAGGADLSARILVAPHHGSDRSFLPELYAAVRPELVLAGCGYRNRWGYPGKRLGAWLAERGIPLLDTGSRGQIVVELPRQGRLAVTTARKGGEPD